MSADLARAVHAEWTKLRTVRGNAWPVLAAVVLTVLPGAAAAGGAGPGVDGVRLSLLGVQVGQVGVVVLAVLAMTGEYGTGTIRPTLAAVPRRGAVLLAKAVVVTATALAAGVLGVLGSLAAGRLLLPGGGFAATDGPVLRAAAGTVLYLGLIALLGLGVGTAVRDTGGAVTAVLALLYLFPLVAQFATDPEWQTRLQKFGPMTAGLAIQSTTGADRPPIGPWAGLGVLAAYAAAALLLGAVLLRARDA